MTTATDPSPTSEAAILSRLIRPEDGNLTAAAAEGFLRIRFDRRDLDRMHELATKNQDEGLTPAEQVEMANYRRVSYWLDLMHSKARRSLNPHQGAH